MRTLLPESSRASPLDRAEEATGRVAADPATVFAYIDLPERLSMHMERRSWRMAGSTMRIETDEGRGQAVGSRYRIVGRALGMRLEAECEVTQRTPPRWKSWETRGVPQLLVIGSYRMSAEIMPAQTGSRVVVHIDYALPDRGLPRWLGKLIGRSYAKWCVRQMVNDVAARFGAAGGPA
jgi:hypothetical protein